MSTNNFDSRNDWNHDRDDDRDDGRGFDRDDGLGFDHDGVLAFDLDVSRSFDLDDGRGFGRDGGLGLDRDAGPRFDQDDGRGFDRHDDWKDGSDSGGQGGHDNGGHGGHEQGWLGGRDEHDDGGQTLVGTNGNDTLSGTAGDDKISGRDGDDDIDGGKGDDNIDGGDGDDSIDGGDGDDKIDGGDGDDSIDGGKGDDKIDGGDGDDSIHGGKGDDNIDGDDGDDSIDGGDGDDNIDGGKGDDYIDGGSGDDRLDGGQGDDTLVGGAGNDYIDGSPHGLDTAIYSGNYLDYQITFSGGPVDSEGYKITVVDMRDGSPDGTDTLRRIEVIRFADGEFRDGQFIPDNTPATIGDPTAATVTEDADVSGGLLVAKGAISVSDPDPGQAIFQTTVVPAPGTLGTLSLASDGSYTYTVANSDVQYLGASDTKADSFTIASADGTSKVVNFTIHGTNDAAVIGGDAAGTVAEAGGVNNADTGTPTATDTLTATDVDSPSSFQAVSAGTPSSNGYGTFAMTSGGLWTYTLDNTNAVVSALNATQTLTDNFTVTTADGTAQLVTITINGTNDAAVISDDVTGTVMEAGGVNNADTGTPTATDTLTATDVDSPSTFQAVSAGTPSSNGYGTFAMTSGGEWTYTLDNTNAAVSALDATQTLTDTFTVTAADGTAQLVTITINGANDAAEIGAPSASVVTEDDAVVAGILKTTGSISISDAEANQSTFQTAVTSELGNLGSLGLGANGSYLYTVANSLVQYLGATDSKVDSFIITSADGTEKEVSFTINGTNDAAVVTGTAAATVREDSTLSASGALSVNDIDTGQSGFQAQTATPGTYGSFTIDTDGQWSYALNNVATNVQALKAGENVTDTFTVTSIDGTTKAFVVTVQGSNDAAVIDGTVAATVQEDVATSASGALTASDTDAGQSGFLAQTATPGIYGSFTIDTEGQWSYALNNGATNVQALRAGVNVTDTFTVTSIDGTTKAFVVTVQGSNDAAAITGTTAAAVQEDAATSASGTLTVSDIDTGQSSFQAQTATPGTYGSFTINAAGAWSYALNNGAANVQALKADENVTDTFTVESVDGTTRPFVVTVQGTNDAPALTGTVATLGAGTEDFTYTVTTTDLLQGYTDADGNTLAVTGLVANHGSVADNGNDGYTITPALNYNGAITLSYAVSDGQGGNTSATRSFNLAAVNDAPVAVADVLAATEGTPVTYTAAQLLGNDSDGDPELTQPLTIASVANGVDGTPTLETDGSVTFSPGLDFTGLASFTYTISDGGDIAVAPATVTVHVTSLPNHAPVLGTPATLEAGTEDTAYPIAAASLLDGFSDWDNDDLSVTGLTGTHGMVTFNGGDYTFTPDADYNGTVTLSYTVTDGHGGNTAATLDFSLAAVNDAPALTGAPATLAAGTEDTAYPIAATSLLQGYTDVDSGDNDALSVTGLSATHGMVTFNGGDYAFTPDAEYNGTVTLSYTVTDSHGGDTAATLGLSLAAVNDAPALTGAPSTLAAGTEDTAYPIAAVTLLQGFSDVDGDTLSVTGLSATHGTITFDNGLYTFTPDAEYNGTVTLSYTVTDGYGGATAATPGFSLAAVNDAAVITGTAAGTVAEDGVVAGTPTASGQLSATDVDSLDSSTAFTVVSTPAATAHGSYTIDATGQWDYTLNNAGAAVQALNAAQTLTDSFTATTADGTQQVVSIAIVGANDAPVLAAPAAIDYTDTWAADTFAAVDGTLDGTDVDSGTTLAYGVSGGALSSSLLDYDWAKTGVYGTLYLNSASGEYHFVADSAAINAVLPDDLDPSDSFTLTVSDGAGGTHSQALSVNVTGANDAAVISGVSGPLEYTVGQSQVLVVAPNLTLGDADSGMVTSATVAISSGFSPGNDILEYQLPDPGPISTVGYDGDTGVLTFTGTASLAEYQAALDSVTFRTSIIGGRTISFTVFDRTIASITVNTSSVSLEDLTTTGFRIPGEAALDGSGNWVSTAGDVNGDGYADMIVGAPWADAHGDYTGRSYVIFGKPSAFGTEVPLWSIDGSNGFRLSGEGAVGQAGFSVSTAGDLNGDGFADIIIGAPYVDGHAGASYVVFGRASFSALLDSNANAELSALGTPGSLPGFRLSGEAAGDKAGLSVSGAGDVNGDGFADVIVGAPYAGPSGEGAGYVVFGSASVVPVSLSDLGSSGFRILGEVPGDRAGIRVSAAGDVNGDGFADVIVGAPFAGPNGTYSGASYVVFGKTPGFSDVQLSLLSGNDGFRISGAEAGDVNGFSVRAAGDVNGDGYGDVIVGSFFSSANGYQSGAAYVVFGKAAGFDPNLDLSALSTSDGFRIVGGAAGDKAGYAVGGAGDVNGDGYDDLIIGATGAGADHAGSSYVVFGKSADFWNSVGFSGTIDLSEIGGSDGFQLSGVASGDDSGYAVGGAGDINGDGFDDMMVASAHASPQDLMLAGESYVIFGGKLVTGPETYLGGSGDDTLTGNPAGVDQTFIGGQGNDTVFGNGGADAFSGGAGDDTMHLGLAGQSAIDFVKVNGGSGFDTLVLDGSGVTLDLTAPGADRFESIERIDLTGNGNNSLVLDIRDLLNMSESSNTLQIGGDGGDAVHVELDVPGTLWTDNGMQGSYHSYSQGLANLLVDLAVTVDFI